MAMTVDELYDHFKVVFRCLERERRMRVKHLRGERRDAGVAEIDAAHESLAAMKNELKGLIEADVAVQQELINTTKQGGY